MRRTMAVIALAVAAVGSSAGHAAAGGSWIEFESRVFVPGDRATGRGIFSITGSGASLREGPFYAYLLPAGRWVSPPTIPASAVPLGPIRVRRIQGQAFLRRATLSFVVPVVPVGTYGIALCNRPCRDAYVGDLIGAGRFRIGFGGDAELRRAFRQLRGQVEQVGARASRREAALEQEITALRGELLVTHWTAQRAEGRSGELQGRVARLERRLVAAAEAADERDTAGSDPAWWLATSLLAVALGWALARLLLRRRRSPSGSRSPSEGAGEVSHRELEELVRHDAERDREPVVTR